MRTRPISRRDWRRLQDRGPPTLPTDPPGAWQLPLLFVKCTPEQLGLRRSQAQGTTAGPSTAGRESARLPGLSGGTGPPCPPTAVLKTADNCRLCLSSSTKDKVGKEYLPDITVKGLICLMDKTSGKLGKGTEKGRRTTLSPTK